MKKENSTLSRKLKMYSAVAGTILASGQAADAQIIYTDLDPDVDMALGSVYGLDLNNDATAEYKITLYTAGAGHTGIFMGGYSVNKMAGETGAYGLAYIYPIVMDAGDEVGPGLDFYASETAAFHPSLLTLASNGFTFTGSYGNWFGETDGYVGLYFQDGTDNKYGWVRLDVGDVGSPQVVVKDYAYNDVPDAPINAGSTTGITTTVAANDGLSIFAFEKDVFISTPKLNDEKLFITVTNMMGQVIRAVGTDHTSLRLGLGDIADGIYLVTVQNGTESVTKKISIK